MPQPLRPVNADGTCCYRVGMCDRPKLICALNPVPTDAVEAEAKRFDADPTSFAVCMLRRTWNDARFVVPVTVDGAASAPTIQESLVRLRLKPGAHRTSARWGSRPPDIDFDGRADDLRVVELVGAGTPMAKRLLRTVDPCPQACGCI